MRTHPDIPDLLQLECPIGPGGTVTVRGLAYRAIGSPDALFALRRAGRATVLFASQDFGHALVRDPRDGALLRAYALRADLARDLTLLAYIDACDAPQWHEPEVNGGLAVAGDEAMAGGHRP